MLVVIFVLVISLAVSQSSDLKKLSEKNLKQQYSKYNFVILKTNKNIEFKITMKSKFNGLMKKTIIYS